MYAYSYGFQYGILQWRNWKSYLIEEGIKKSHFCPI